MQAVPAPAMTAHYASVVAVSETRPKRVESPARLSRLSVQGYKSLADVTVELGVFNVFIGPNAGGKSNLLEAVGLMGAAAFGSVEPESLRYRGVRLGFPSRYKTSLRDQPHRRVISLEAQGRGALYRVALDNPIEDVVAKWKFTHETLEQDGDVLLSRSPRGGSFHVPDGEEQIELEPEEGGARLAVTRRKDATNAAWLVRRLERFAIFTPFTPVLRGVLPELVEREPLGLTGGGLARAVGMLMKDEGALGEFDMDDVRELLDWAEDVRAVALASPHGGDGLPQQPSLGFSGSQQESVVFWDRFMRKDRQTLTAYDASEGALYVLFLLVVASQPRQTIFAIDNFDQGLHPKLARHLTETVASKAVARGGPQLLLTTHNPMVLDALDLTDDRIRLFAVERAKTGQTVVRRIEVSESIITAAESGLTLSRLWLMGRLGAFPAGL